MRRGGTDLAHGRQPAPEGCGCDEETLAATIAAQPPIELVGPDEKRQTVHAEDFA